MERAAALGQGIIRVDCHTHMPQLGMAETVTGPTIDNHAAPDAGAYRNVYGAPATPGSTLYELRQPRCVDVTVDCDGDAKLRQGVEVVQALPQGFRGCADDAVVRHYRIDAQWTKGSHPNGSEGLLCIALTQTGE